MGRSKNSIYHLYSVSYRSIISFEMTCATVGVSVCVCGGGGGGGLHTFYLQTYDNLEIFFQL